MVAQLACSWPVRCENKIAGILIHSICWIHNSSRSSVPRNNFHLDLAPKGGLEHVQSAPYHWSKHAYEQWQLAWRYDCPYMPRLSWHAKALGNQDPLPTAFGAYLFLYFEGVFQMPQTPSAKNLGHASGPIPGILSPDAEMGIWHAWLWIDLVKCLCLSMPLSNAP